MCTIFKEAKAIKQELNSTVRLVYNDYAHGFNEVEPWNADGHRGKADRVFEVIRDMVARDCGVEAVGFQYHHDMAMTSFEEVRANMTVGPPFFFKNECWFFKHAFRL